MFSSATVEGQREELVEYKQASVRVLSSNNSKENLKTCFVLVLKTETVIVLIIWHLSRASDVICIIKELSIYLVFDK